MDGKPAWKALDSRDGEQQCKSRGPVAFTAELMDDESLTLGFSLEYIARRRTVD